MSTNEPVSRRDAIGRIGRIIAGAATATVLPGKPAQQGARTLLTRPIPSSGERLPVVGLGTWITFNVGDDRKARDECAEVMRAFFEAGGRLIDSSPMYGSSQEVVGYGLAKLGAPATLFSADKVWTASGREGRSQIE